MTELHRNQKNGFYVYAKPNLCNPSIVTRYIGRYLGRPVIATSRIDKYDGELVTFHYNRHEDDKLIYETIPVLDFMQRLIRHNPEKNFKMIRYYGIYARHRSSDKKLRRVIPKEKHRILLTFNRQRDCLLSSFGYDPLKCPDCGSTMRFLELYFKHRRVSLNELYERTMAKHRGCRSPSSPGGISSCTVSSGCSKLSMNGGLHPPEGMPSGEIRSMSDEELLDMDYFLKEEDFDFGEEGEEGFYIF